MTGQEELEKIAVLERQIEEQELYIQELKEALSGLGAIRYDKEVVQSSPPSDPLALKLIKLEEEEDKLQVMKQKYVNHKVHCIDMIHHMDSIDHKKLLYLVYINGYSLKNASEKMNYSYDYIRKMHRKALFEIGTVKHSETFA